MNHRERFHATVERKAVDRPACWLGMPAPEAEARLCAFLGAADLDGLRIAANDDVWPVDLPYHAPGADAIWAALDFRKDKSGAEGRTLTAPGFFEGMTDPGDVDAFDWPDPERGVDAAECRRAVAAAPADRAVLGVAWSAHFQDACAAFGMESALGTMLTAPEMFRAVIDRITEFYLAANSVFYEAAGGRLDAVLIGNDFGAQTGLMLSPALIREFVFPGARLLVSQAKQYGLKVIHHSCGAIRPIIPDLIEMGVDAVHPIQALATGMDAAALRAEFGDRASFCGGVDAQRLLVSGTADEVRAEVRRLRRLFPTGLVISPSHEAILADVPPANIGAMLEEATHL